MILGGHLKTGHLWTGQNRPKEAASETGAEASVRDAGAETASGVPDGGASYSTTFDRTEAPISENGAWTHLGLDWALVDTENGVALGTQTGKGGYDDSYAHLTGFPPDHEATGVIHKIATIDPSCTHEVEIHLPWPSLPKE